MVDRISISEEDLGSSPVVYRSVGGAHADVYVPIAERPESVEGSAKVATWVLVVAAVVLAVAFGVGGYVLGQSGRVSRADVQSTRASDRARSEADQRTAVRTATDRVRRQDAASAQRRITAARAAGVAKGRRIGEREAQQTSQQGAVDSLGARGADCLTAVEYCDD